MTKCREFDVTQLITKENVLKICFHSPLKYIAEAHKKYGNRGSDDTYEGFMHLRKAHYMFGWDWGAHLPDAGIFRKVSLLGIEKARIDSVYIAQKHEEKEMLPDIDVFEQYVSYQAFENGEEIASGTAIFSYPKYFKYQDPSLTCRVDGEYITVFADKYAKSVEIQNENQDLVLSDNYFDMNGGERKVKILRGKPEQITLRSVYDIK